MTKAKLGLRRVRSDAGTHGADRNEGVSSVAWSRAVTVRFVGAGVGRPFEQKRPGLPIGTRLMQVRIAMDQLPVLGAAAMLDQKHMAAGRTLQHECEQRRQDASTSNHSEFG